MDFLSCLLGVDVGLPTESHGFVHGKGLRCAERSAARADASARDLAVLGGEAP